MLSVVAFLLYSILFRCQQSRLHSVNSVFQLYPELTFLVEKVTGTVKWFSITRRYGFIQRDDNQEDVFVHRTAITASKQRFPSLKTGEPVEFSVVQTTGGINAASVTGPGGKPVKVKKNISCRGDI
ncbi:unnamed protein product [Schistocephalus solidus]|uniref:CSD_1 domain-containing protein n=1 Tax=Schistocephalus solidus TaxID=70667 RepID=A0A183S7T5_SCHSO|nr:unnamed protein product [Schistocephalus solidus]